MRLLTPLSLARACFFLAAVGLVVVLIGPFQGLERNFGLSDEFAHGLAFYAFTVGLFVVLPRFRRIDIALAGLALAASSEIAQSFTGRSGSFSDFTADALGILCAVSPAIAERWRYAVVHGSQASSKTMGRAPARAGG